MKHWILVAAFSLALSPCYAQDVKPTAGAEGFVRQVVLSPLENKSLMSNKRVLEVYKYQGGDLYCDASHAREGVESFIDYDKAFIYIIRKVGGKWTLIGIGG